MVTYVKTNEKIKNNFKFEKSFVFRTEVEEYIKECYDADVLLCSCYVWNWEITKYLASEVKKINPNCTIIFGGAQIPDLAQDFFKQHPYVDIIAHGEGEYILENILTAYLKDKDYSQVKGIETKEFRNQLQERINELDNLPSPYLTNTVWDLVEKVDGIRWIVGWETNRGCPYACTFCDWGSATFTKVRKWEESRLFKEIEWFAENKIPYIDCCDANFGIFQERDFRIAEKLKEVALKTNYPERVRPAWAKNSSEKIIPIAKQLQDGGILGAVTLAVQSLDPDTLKIVKRANIKFDTFSELASTFRKNGIPTYTELIMGMPGETLQSFKDGLDSIAMTKVDTVFIYNCTVLPNAPMNVPEYREKYKIKIVRSPIMLVHSSIHNRGTHQEYEEIVVETSTCSCEDLKETYLYSWCFLTLQSLGILKHIATYYNIVHNIRYTKFYEVFMEFCCTAKSIFSDEVNHVIEFRDGGYTGKGWDEYDPKLGDIMWPIEEASWLRLTYNKEKFHQDAERLVSFIDKKFNLNTPEKLLNDLVKFEVFTLSIRDNKDEVKSENFEFDWKNFFTNDGNELKQIPKRYYYKNLVIENDPIMWGYKTIWYGRRAGNYKCQLQKLQEDEVSISDSNKDKPSDIVVRTTR
ncbi:MAG TPA: radical SAM protein, partial [Candidatus Nitrosopelagicus sp.]|nr:radical SAM protein [Candidatus Nitrosopelagicus sp.]